MAAFANFLILHLCSLCVGIKKILTFVPSFVYGNLLSSLLLGVSKMAVSFLIIKEIFPEDKGSSV